MIVGKNMDVPTCVVLFHFLHYSSLDSIYTYFILEYRGVEPKTEAVPPSRASALHHNTGAVLVLDLCTRSGQTPFFSVEPVLPFTLVRKRGLEWLEKCISQKHAAVIPYCRKGSCSIFQDFLV
jgi:hypothetical protein